MVAAGFGWSTGDLLQAIRTIYEISKGFREIGGAETHFQLSAAWLESFGHDLEQVRRFIEMNPEATCNPGLQEKMLLIRSSYTDFVQYLDNYDTFLPTSASLPQFHWRNGIRSAKKASQTVKWTWNELNRRVDDLRKSVTLPLAEMNLVLLLHMEYVLSYLKLTTADRDYRDNLRNLSNRCETLPQSSDVSEIKDIVVEHASQLARIAATSDEILDAVRKNRTISFIDECLSLERQLNHSTALERLGLLCGHYEASEHAVQAFRQADLIRGRARSQMEEFAGRLLHIVEATDEAKEHIVTHLEKSMSSIAALAEKATETMELNERITQMTNDIQGVRHDLDGTRSQLDTLNAQSMLQTGVSVAAATASVVCMLKTVFDNKPQEQKTATRKDFNQAKDLLPGSHAPADVTAFNWGKLTASACTASFEAKWAVLTTKCAGKTSLSTLIEKNDSLGMKEGRTTNIADVKLIDSLELIWKQKTETAKRPLTACTVATCDTKVSQCMHTVQEQVTSQTTGQHQQNPGISDTANDKAATVHG